MHPSSAPTAGEAVQPWIGTSAGVQVVGFRNEAFVETIASLEEAAVLLGASPWARTWLQLLRGTYGSVTAELGDSRREFASQPTRDRCSVADNWVATGVGFAVV